eukprot:64989_1
MSKSVFKMLDKCNKWRLILLTIVLLIILLEIHSIFFLIPSNYTLISHMEDLRHAKVSLYQVHGNEKFFRESENDNHLDSVYSKGYIERNETIDTLYFLFEEFFNWLQKNKSISKLRTAYLSHDIMPSEYLFDFNIKPNDGLIYFLDYGTLLGSYRNQSIIPWDVNGDIGFMIKDIQQLPLQYETKTWIFKQNPMFHKEEEMNIYDSHNTVAARLISKKNGVFINIMPYSLIFKQDMIYVYSTADFLQHEKWHKANDLFPLNKTGGTLKQLNYLPIPHNVKKWLLTYYPSLTIPQEHLFDNNNYNDNYDFDRYNMYDGWGGYDADHKAKINELKEQLEQQKEEIEKLKELILTKRKDKTT